MSRLDITNVAHAVRNLGDCASGTEPAAHRVVSEAECDDPSSPILLIGPADDADQLINLAVAPGRKEEAGLAEPNLPSCAKCTAFSRTFARNAFSLAGSPV